MKKLLTVIWVCFTLLLFGQNEPDSVQLQQSKYDDEVSMIESEEIENYIQNKKLRFNFEFGTTFTASKYGSYFGTYVAPHFTYPLTHRLSISAGGYFTGITPMNQGENQAVFGQPYGTFYTRSFVYVEGAYRLTENLTVTGTAYKEINLFNPANPGYRGNNFDSRGFIMGLDYKLGDNVFIRGQVEISNGQSPYHTSPFTNPAGSRMQDPFFFNP